MNQFVFIGTRAMLQAANIKATLAKRAAEAAAQRRRVEAPSTPTPQEAKPHTDQQVDLWLCRLCQLITTLSAMIYIQLNRRQTAH